MELTISQKTARFSEIAQEITRVSLLLEENLLYFQKADASRVTGVIEKDTLLRRAKKIIQQRRMRARYIKTELFGEPAWDILLDLFVAEIEGKNISISSLCIASGAPQTTALRYINCLSEAGVITRQADANDRRRIYASLCPEVFVALRRYISEEF